MGMLGRLLTGGGCGCAWLGAVKVCRTNFGCSGRMSDTMLGVSNCLGGVGGFISQGPFGALVDAVGWRSAFRILAVVPAALAVLSLLFIEDEPLFEADAFDASAAGEASSGGGGALHGVSDDPDGRGGGEGHTKIQTKILQAEQDHGEGGGRGGGADAEPPPSCMKAFARIATDPRVICYGVYLAGTDSPFENFASLWGVSYLHQAVGWTKTNASWGLSGLTIVATCMQVRAAVQPARMRVRVCVCVCACACGGGGGRYPFYKLRC
jgi:hypothetical protein